MHDQEDREREGWTEKQSIKKKKMQCSMTVSPRDLCSRIEGDNPHERDSSRSHSAPVEPEGLQNTAPSECTQGDTHNEALLLGLKFDDSLILETDSW